MLDRNIAREGTAPEVGRSLNGFGINLLVEEIDRTMTFLKQVFGMEIHRADKAFAVLEHRGDFVQMYADHTYHHNPLPGAVELSRASDGLFVRELVSLDIVQELHFGKSDAARRCRNMS